MKVRTRIAPSPTGFFHIGNLRTALYDYALAKRHDGEFLLRIEDTDRSRYVPEAEDFIHRMFAAFGLNPDEGPNAGGPHQPYRQSERLDIYRKFAEQLVQEGKAYYDFLTEDEAKELQEAARASQQGLRSPYRDLSLEEAKQKIEDGESYTIRFKIPKDRDVTGVCELQGEMSMHSKDIEDWVMIKSDGFPVYNFAVVIDDYLMEVTDVMRGVEFVSSLPKNVLLYEALGWESPKFYHLPVLMDPAGGKLSKRSGAVNVEDFLMLGYLPPAVLNFLMLLGWSSPEEREHGESEREIYSLQEFTEIFATADLNKSNPVFDRKKLLWFNQQYLSDMPIEDLAHELTAWVDAYGEEYADTDDAQQVTYQVMSKMLQDDQLQDKLKLVNTRVKTLAEIPEQLAFFYDAPTKVDWEIKQTKRVTDNLPDILDDIVELLADMPANTDEWEHEKWEQGMRNIGDEYDHKHGDIFMVLRIALVGGPYSPPLFEAMQLMDKDEVMQRLEFAQGQV